MPDLTPQAADAVLSACQAGAAEAAEALSRALDAAFTLAVGTPATLDPNALPAELAAPGLAAVLTLGASGAMIVLPEGTGLLPGWVAQPDLTGQSKLRTLAQELGMTLLPAEFMADDFRAARVKSLAGALKRGGLAAGAAVVPLQLSAGDKQGTALLVWPIANPAMVLGSAESKAESKPAAATPSKPAAKPPAAQAAAATRAAKPARRRAARVEDLPNYTRSLLRIKVPVIVTLAEQRQPLRRVIELGPGSIIQFDKSCEETLDLEVGNHAVARGEAVKVGDKFGLRITSIILPAERFRPVAPP
jgi:flagellar motor switch/type III secretory pathway protein FliN